MTDTVLFRFHRGSLDDSMKTVVEIDTWEQLEELIEESWQVKISAMEIKPYIYDDRIDWETQIVTIKVCADETCVTYPVGFLNKPLPLNNKESSE